jgi:hypothetical protein
MTDQRPIEDYISIQVISAEGRIGKSIRQGYNSLGNLAEAASGIGVSVEADRLDDFRPPNWLRNAVL